MAVVAHALTTRDRVKDKLPNVSNTNFDTLIDRLIDSVTDFVETVCDRRFLKTTYTQEIYDGRNDSGSSKTTLRLKNFPVDSNATFTLEYKTGTNTWTAFVSTDFVVDYDSGIVHMVDGSFPNGFRNIRATYDAGYGIDFTTPANHTLPYDITEAVEELVIRKFKKRENYGRSSQSAGNDQISWLDSIDKEIMEVLHRYQKCEFL